MTPLPTRNDINVFDSLDERIACDHFFGKSLEEAEQLFRELPLVYQEDLMWMGPVAFRYYVTAVIGYIKSDFATGDSDIINCYGGLLEFRLETDARANSNLGAACGQLYIHRGTFRPLRYDADEK